MDFLYGGDQRYRLCQEIVPGTGGVRMLRTIGYGSNVWLGTARGR